MTSTMISMKLENTLLTQIDEIVLTEQYQNRTELFRELLRNKLEEVKLKRSLLSLKGSEKKQTSQKQYEKIREFAFEQFAKKFS